MVKLRKCCRCRTVYPEDEAVKKPHQKFNFATEDVCPKCGAGSYYLHHAGEKKAPRPEVYRASPWPISKEAHELKALEQQHKALFMEWVTLCASNRELLAQYDRLRGTNLSRCGSPMDLLIDQATGRLEADALGFFEFCQDMFLRIDPESLFARKY